MLAACRHADRDLQTQTVILSTIQNNLKWAELDKLQKLHLLRVCGLAIIRSPSQDTRPVLYEAFNRMFSEHYPCDSVELNRELCRLLVACDADGIVSRTLDLVDNAVTQEEQILYIMCLRKARSGWTDELRERYLKWFVKSAVFQGGKSFAGYLKNARDEFVAGLADQDKEKLASLINAEMQEQDPYAELKTREVIKDWTVDDLLPLVEQTDLTQRDLENGKRVFATAQCYKCHQFAGSGGIVGPDLTGLSRRYTNQYLLETLIDPSKEISSQYQATLFELENGKMVTGRVANLNNNTYMIQEDMISPGRLTNINRKDIYDSRPSKVSPMPENLLDTFTREEILDLLAYLRSADQDQ